VAEHLDFTGAVLDLSFDKGSVISPGPFTLYDGNNAAITNISSARIDFFTGTIASPRVVTISTSNGQYVATNDLGTNVIGNITHSGSPALMVFDTGDNTLSIADDTHTTGTVKVSFNAPYL